MNSLGFLQVLEDLDHEKLPASLASLAGSLWRQKDSEQSAGLCCVPCTASSRFERAEIRRVPFHILLPSSPCAWDLTVLVYWESIVARVPESVRTMRSGSCQFRSNCAPRRRRASSWRLGVGSVGWFLLLLRSWVVFGKFLGWPPLFLSKCQLLVTNAFFAHSQVQPSGRTIEHIEHN